MRPVVAIGLSAAGVMLIYGGITGRLAPMLAALFYPSALTEKSSSGLNIPGIGKVPIPGLGNLGPHGTL